MFKALAEMFETTVVSVSEADAVDETVESAELLAREAARKVFEESGAEAEYVVEMETGFAVVGDNGQSIFMGHNGGFELVDTPEDEEPEDDDTANEDDEDLNLDDDPDENAEPLTLEGLTTNVEAVVDSIEDYGAAVGALRKFDEAKAAEDMDAALAAVELLEKVSTVKVSRSQPLPTPATPPAPRAPTDVQGTWKPSGNPYVPTPKTPAPPKKPVSVGPGPGKSTGKDGSTGGKVGVPTSAPPAPKPPKSAGNTKESVDVRVPRDRIDEFLKLAAEAGAPNDANVETAGDEFIITLPEDVAEAVGTLMG
jgi:hypothetical protein